MEEAKNMLTRSSLPINTVSIYVGYSNFSYFTKMFRENTGFSPLEYRRKFKINQ
ncbi:AraC family transcriptional regulator [Blautia sp. JLR.GB0024]|uniref:helix-turn-helix domain-containing protein n=1 Tax=Blautia sp. JLR.GB0024 TaxID=3123295 RepID=UPI003006EBB8